MPPKHYPGTGTKADLNNHANQLNPNHSASKNTMTPSAPPLPTPTKPSGGR